MNQTHELKSWPFYFQAVWDGHKCFEVRKNDRNFKNGDQVILKEWNPETLSYTGRTFLFEIIYVHRGLGMEEGFVVIGFKNVWQGA